MKATCEPALICDVDAALGWTTLNRNGWLVSVCPFTSATMAGMTNSPVRCGVTEKATVTVELIAPFTQLTFWEVPAWLICRPETPGVGTVRGEPPSNASDKVVLWPSVRVSLSSDAVKLAAHAGVAPTHNRKRQEPAATGTKLNLRSRQRRKFFPRKRSIPNTLRLETTCPHFAIARPQWFISDNRKDSSHPKMFTMGASSTPTGIPTSSSLTIYAGRA